MKAWSLNGWRVVFRKLTASSSRSSSSTRAKSKLLMTQLLPSMETPVAWALLGSRNTAKRFTQSREWSTYTHRSPKGDSLRKKDRSDSTTTQKAWFRWQQLSIWVAPLILEAKFCKGLRANKPHELNSSIIQTDPVVSKHNGLKTLPLLQVTAINTPLQLLFKS